MTPADLEKLLADCERQGFPRTIEDPAALQQIANVLARCQRRHEAESKGRA